MEVEEEVPALHATVAGGSEPVAAPAASPLPLTTVDGSGVELDAEDLAAIADVKKKGYRYFARKLGAEETAAIGDIRPKNVTAAAPTSAQSFAPTPVLASAAPSVSSASAWNAGNTTHEERNVSAWAKARVKELIEEGRASGELEVPLPGVGRVVVTGIKGWGSSSADIVISRGKTRFIYDLHFSFVASVVGEGEAVSPVGEGDEEAVGTTLPSPPSPTPSKAATPPPPSAVEPKAEAAGVQAEGGGSSGGDAVPPPVASSPADGVSGVSAEPKEDSLPELKPAAAAASSTAIPALAAPAPAAAKKHPRMLLSFPDIGNDTEEDAVTAGGKGREVRIEWGTPAPAEGQQEMLRRVAGVGSPAGLVSALQAIVERVVTEFKRK